MPLFAHDPVTFFVTLLVGLLIGVLGALLGTGGGFILVPFLVLFAGVPIKYAIAASLVAVIATSSSVASVNVGRHLPNMRLGVTLELATVLGAFTGSIMAGFLTGHILSILFACCLVMIAVLMFRKSGMKEERVHSPVEGGHLNAHYFDKAINAEVHYGVERLPVGMVASFVAGNLSGLLGIGGGVLKVPALTLWCGIPMKAAAATSNFMIGVTAVASAFIYYSRNEIDPILTAAVVIGVLAGSIVGTTFSERVQSQWLSRIFAVVVLILAAQMFWRAK